MTPQRFLIFGATGGIGSALAHRLVDLGHRPFLSARGADRLAALADALKAPAAPADVRIPGEVRETVDAATRELGGLDGAVLAVGSILLKPGHLTSPEDLQQTLDINLVSAFNVLRATVPALRKSGGSLLFFSSAAASLGLANHEAIAAAKAGLEGMVRSAAASYAHWGIRVNAIAPGLVETPLAQGLLQNEASRKASVALHPLRALGQPADVANAAAWALLQPWMTGQVVGVDGGLARVRSKD